MRASWWLVLGLAACGGRHPARPPAGHAAATQPAAPDRGRWIPGDLHEHVAPVDDPEAVALDVAGVTALAQAQGLEFVVLTPHLWPRVWDGAEARADFLARWQTMATQAAAQREVTLLPGTEFSIPALGHFGVVGADLAALCATGREPGCRGAHFLEAARGAGAFVTVNHPFALPTHIPGVEASDYDMSFRPWSHGRGSAPGFDAVEIWNLPLSLANIISSPGGQTGEQRALAEADRLARSQRRRVVLVGGSDNHSRILLPTTWVRAPDRSAKAILAGLRAGAVCVGGAEAGDLEAHGDGDPAGDWRGIGATVSARAAVSLRWQGPGELFVDGVSRGLHADGLAVAVDAAPHTFRLVKGGSRSGFVYANFP